MATLKYGPQLFQLADTEANNNLVAKLASALKNGGLLWIETKDGSSVALGFPTGVDVVYVGDRPVPVPSTATPVIVMGDPMPNF